MMVLLGYFLIAAVAGVSASPVIGLFLTNFIIGRSKLPIERRNKELLIIACGASSAFLVTKLKLAWPVC
jgi:hypothetical protein